MALNSLLCADVPLRNCSLTHYLLPSRTAANAVSPTPITSLAFLPAIEDTLIGRDLNAHSNLWDSEQPTDNRGELATDWILEKDMVCV